MATYDVTGPDGKAYEIEGPSGASHEQVLRALQHKLYAPKPEPETPGALGTFARSAGKGVLPTAGAIGGAEAGALAGSAFFPGVGTVIGGLGGALLGSYGASKAQDAALGAMPDTAKKLGLDDASMAAAAKANPIAAKAGEWAPAVASFGVANPLVNKGAAAMGAGVNSAIDLGQQLVSGQPVDWGSVGESALGGAFLKNENPNYKSWFKGKTPAAAAPTETPPPAAPVSSLAQPADVGYDIQGTRAYGRVPPVKNNPVFTGTSDGTVLPYAESAGDAAARQNALATVENNKPVNLARTIIDAVPEGTKMSVLSLHQELKKLTPDVKLNDAKDAHEQLQEEGLLTKKGKSWVTTKPTEPVPNPEYPQLGYEPTIYAGQEPAVGAIEPDSRGRDVRGPFPRGPSDNLLGYDPRITGAPPEPLGPNELPTQDSRGRTVVQPRGGQQEMFYPEEMGTGKSGNLGRFDEGDPVVKPQGTQLDLPGIDTPALIAAREALTNGNLIPQKLREILTDLTGTAPSKNLSRDSLIKRLKQAVADKEQASDRNRNGQDAGTVDRGTDGSVVVPVSREVPGDGGAKKPDERGVADTSASAVPDTKGKAARRPALKKRSKVEPPPDEQGQEQEPVDAEVRDAANAEVENKQVAAEKQAEQALPPAKGERALTPEPTAKSQPYFEPPAPAVKTYLTRKEATPEPRPISKSARAVRALRDGDLGKALYHLMYEAGGDAKHGVISPLRSLAESIFNVIDRTDDRSEIIKAHKAWVERNLEGDERKLTPVEHRQIEDMINNDFNLNPKHFTDVDGKLTKAGELIMQFKPEYERMVELTNKARINRLKGIFEAGSQNVVKGGAFGNARVVVEGHVKDAEDAAILKRLKAEGKLSVYDSDKNAFYFTEAGLNDKTILHEMVHAATVKVLRRFETNPGSLTSVQREGAEHVNKIYEAAKERLADKYPTAFENVYEFVSHASTEEGFQRELAGIRMLDLGVTPRRTVRELFSQFMTAVAKMFGLDRFARQAKPFDPLIRDAERGDNVMIQMAHTLHDIMAVPKAGNNAGLLYATKQAEPPVIRTAQQIIKGFGKDSSGVPYDKVKRPGILKTLKSELFTREGWRNIETNLQNQHARVKDLQENMRKAGHDNMIYDYMTGAPSLMEQNWGRASSTIRELDSILAKFGQATGKNYREVLDEFHGFSIARGEPSKREMLYAKGVPLENTKIRNDGIGSRPMTAADERHALLDELGNSVDNARADAINKRLMFLAKNAADPLGDTPMPKIKAAPKNEATNIDSALYNVAGDYTKDELAALRTYHDMAMKSHGDLIDKAFEKFHEIHEMTKELNRQAGYWPKQLDGIVRAYDFKDYMPFRGKNSPYADETDPRKFLSGSHSEMEQGYEGRNTDSDNPILQTLSELSKAAGRAARSKVPDEVARLINEGSIAGKRLSDVSFASRFLGNVSKEDMQRPDVIFRHMPDGRIERYQVTDRKMLEAIKGFTGDVGSFWKAMNAVTSGVGRMHTAYNPPFALWNFLRHGVTSSTFVGADMGPGVAAKYGTAIASKLVDGGIAKAWKMAMAFHKGDTATMDRLKSQHPFYNEIHEWLQSGGRASYMQTMRIKDGGDLLVQSVGKSKVMHTMDHVDMYFQVWADAFEFASRSAGFGVIKSEFLQKAMEKNGGKALSAEQQQQVSIQAAQYTKNLFNFQEVGKYGREAGSLFMFIRPAMTTAVRFHDAFAPLYTGVETAMKQLPKSVTDVDTVYSNLMRNAKPEDKKTAEQKAAIRQQAESQVKQSIDTFTKNHAKQQRNAGIMAAGMMGMGSALYTMALAASDTDDQGRNKVAKDDMSMWSRNMRLPIHGAFGPGNDFFDLPWGWGFGVFGAFGAQLAATAAGNNTVMDMTKNMIPVALEAALPLPTPKYSPLDHPLAFVMSSVVPSFAKPIIEYGMNINEFGQPIYSNDRNAFGNPYTAPGNLPDFYSNVTGMLADHTGVAISPASLHFFLNSYADGVSRITADASGIASDLAGKRDFDPKTDLVAFDNFIGKSTSVDARDFSKAEERVQAIKNRLRMYEGRDQQLQDYLEANPNAEMIVHYYDAQVNGQLKSIRHAIKQVEADPDLTPREKHAQLQDLKENRDAMMRAFLDGVDAYL